MAVVALWPRRDARDACKGELGTAGLGSHGAGVRAFSTTQRVKCVVMIGIFNDKAIYAIDRRCSSTRIIPEQGRARVDS